MAVIKKIKRAARGDVSPTTIALEALRRTRVSLRSRRERTNLGKKDHAPAALLPRFSRMGPDELLTHFQGARLARFFSGFEDPEIAELQRQHFPDQTGELTASATRIADDHCWSLLGFGEKCFGDEVEWNRDPLSGYVWPLAYHRDIELIRSDGSDVRVLWELNRLGHLITLGRAYTLTNDERFTAEFLVQLRSWTEQNPYCRGANWSCAMEVALRAMNLLAAFELFRRSPRLDPGSLVAFLRLLQQHGNYIRGHLEFSYVATSNHYLSDVAGLLWLGLMLPELRDAEYWRDFGLAQLLREMDKQVLADGADFEASTGYHRFVLELFLYSFLLCRANAVEINQNYWSKLRNMFIYLRGYLRSDGFAPLIGDSDSGQVLPIRRRRGDDHGYLLAIGAVLFDDASLKPEGMEAPEELLWILGEAGLTAFQDLGSSSEILLGAAGETPALPASKAFPQAGTYIMREGDLYLCFNASGAGINGRGSHGHNDALSIEVSAGDRAFIIDPGTYVYTADLQKRHEFRSTAYHSTVRIDGLEQNTTECNAPFLIGDEAHPQVLAWETGTDSDKVVAEHYGYLRLRFPVTHRRTVIFNKQQRWWLIEDEFPGDAEEHDFEVRFHFAPGLEVTIREAGVEAREPGNDSGLFVASLSFDGRPELESQAASRDYGETRASVSVCWRISGPPRKLSWQIRPPARR